MNTLFLMADEMSWWALGHMNAAVHTPNLDRLAAQGLRFDAAYTPSPICVPARAAIATGKYVHQIGTWSSAQAYEGTPRSWGHAVQATGAEAVSIGKLHYRSAADDTGFSRQINPIHIPDGIGWVRGLLRKPLCSYDATADLAEMIGAGDSDYLHYDREVTAEAVDWLGQPERKRKPWAAFVSWVCPHYPFIAPQEFYDLYDPADYEGGAGFVPDHAILREIAGFFSHEAHFTPQTRGIARAAYFGLCSFIDAQVGKVLKALEAAGMADDTLIIFTSDHGEMLGERGFWTKSCMYDSAARVPLIVAGAGIDAGIRTDPVSLIDIAPTIVAAMGGDTDGFDGCDLRAPPDPDRTVLSEYHDGGASVGITMVRWGRWKYVHYAEGHPSQLFDVGRDPAEAQDLATARPDICAEALQRLAKWMDPEEVNQRAHADQATRVTELGGRAKLEAAPQWNFTPADSR